MNNPLRNRLETLFSWEMIEGLWELFFKYLPIYLFVKLYRKKEDCWLFTERPSDARDNGFVLYKWINDNHPEYKIVYAIDFKAQDYDKVKGIGTVIKYGSYKHWYYYFASKACCGTTWSCCCPNNIVFLMTRHCLPTKSKRVFLQHGITKDFMPEATYQKLAADIFVCGAYPEWKYINEAFGYPNGHVKYLGFARFDRLISTSGRSQILYMPTWRKWLVTEKEFEKTDYYKRISSLLSSKRLSDFLEENNIDVVYFTHPSIRELKSFFCRYKTNHIHIFNNDDIDLQKLICSANMLITDYSSIYFDFAYQDKPVLYYHFDYERYRKSHFGEGYFSYEDDGFGPILRNEEELIEKIQDVYSSNWHLSEEYAKRRESFFPIKDKNNCLRHFETLLRLDN